MRRARIFLTAVAVLALAASEASARGLGKLVTKATQAKMELDYDLSAIQEPNAVVLDMKIPKRGKLSDVRRVRLSVMAEDGKHCLIRLPLERENAEGAIRVTGQITPELAANAHIELVMEEGRREFYYYVRLADYVTERAAK